ncbi:hypothetical protein MFIFM68171_04830 [Madurella fahalii]|uniref:N-acetyltransferase domain-containing protein n=1 Tax=Madurella fahalii TaxID=1157608 RepID=A0ABQ0GA92_9PEZI
MQITLRPATARDTWACASTAAAAFANSALIRRVSPNAQDVARAFWSAVVASGIEDPDTEMVVAEDASATPPAFLGFAKWVHVRAGAPAPGILRAGANLRARDVAGRQEPRAADGEGVNGGVNGGEHADADPDVDLWSMTAEPELARRFFTEQNERHEKYMGRREHWYLELICAKPGEMGKGVGKRLLQWGLEKVDADGCEAYLEASPDGRPLFEKFGWKVVERLEYLDGEYVECSMVRDAVSAREENAE